MDEKEKLFNSGVLVAPRKGAVRPPEDLWRRKKNGLVIIECPQRIPCNPCHTSCPTGAVKPFKDINDQPEIDYEKCTGCANCVAVCPGLACFVVDLTWGDEDQALMKIPYEMLPIPSEGEIVECLDREGKAITRGKVIKVLEPLRDRTRVVHVEVPKSLVMEVRAIKVVKQS
ncbi:MAG TPA: 4Fe-4S dicluster domain-containing protein [Synergistales bacterium]|jgi:Fe-S-cluster-containing hydrogenase component 2|nr:4Fe-4S dicluster domain-containing protein [Synergistales bacterium]HOR53671.1 4Fe-4S dicluster domain-containing protein [Synergistales bacterium]HPK42709.1 4Fe-4S dicluster domain-containing protein [Synergistales bacterium]